MSSDSQAVKRILGVLGEEFPGYNEDGRSLKEACFTICAVAGALGAHILLRGGRGSFGRYITMLQTQTDQFAHEAVRAMQKGKMQ